MKSITSKAIRISLFLIVYIASFNTLQAQEQSNLIEGKPDSIFNLYKQQFSSLLQSRGISGHELLFTDFKKMAATISNPSDVANELAMLYPADRGIAILYYLFHNDTLKRILFEPGKIIEEKSIPIKKDEILNLNSEISQMLNLQTFTAQRSPVQRGNTVINKRSKLKISADSVIRKATSLLLPDYFDEHYKHLIIIPALNIGTYPFHLLKPYRDGSYLIDKCSFSVAPGMIDLFMSRKKLLRSVDLFEGFSSIDSTLRITYRPLFVSNPLYPKNTNYHFPDLPGAAKEISSSLSISTNYTLLEGSTATKANVLKDLAKSDLAYFATHGISDPNNPLDGSFIVLSGENDPFLTAREIMDFRQQSDNEFHSFPDLVILSACQTGLGNSMEAGVTGLARSFLIAGSEHVIMSLWNVDDEATAFFMSRFIYHLHRPAAYSPADPLRHAALDTRKRFPKISQWAAFSMFGTIY